MDEPSNITVITPVAEDDALYRFHKRYIQRYQKATPYAISSDILPLLMHKCRVRLQMFDLSFHMFALANNQDSTKTEYFRAFLSDYATSR